METPIRPPEAVRRFLDSAGKIPAAKAGTDILVQDRTEQYGDGYTATPLEREVEAAVGEVRTWLGQPSADLSGEALAGILQGFVQCSRAVDEYRARYQGAAGDYDDFPSHLSYCLRDLLQDLRKILKQLDADGRFPLAAVPEHLLRSKATLYDEVIFTQEVYKFFLSEEMRTWSREPFPGIVRQQGEEIRDLIRSLRAAPRDRKTWIMRDLVSRFFHTRAEVASEVAGCLLPYLGDSNPDIRREAATSLGNAGFRVFPFLREAYPRTVGQERALLLQVLQTLERNAYSAHRPEISAFLSNLPPEAPER